MARKLRKKRSPALRRQPSTAIEHHTVAWFREVYFGEEDDDFDLDDDEDQDDDEEEDEDCDDGEAEWDASGEDNDPLGQIRSKWNSLTERSRAHEDLKDFRDRLAKQDRHGRCEVRLAVRMVPSALPPDDLARRVRAAVEWYITAHRVREVVADDSTFNRACDEICSRVIRAGDHYEAQDRHTMSRSIEAPTDVVVDMINHLLARAIPPTREALADELHTLADQIAKHG